MSKSYRTELPGVIAARNFRRDREDEPILPRIVERPPRRGDVHPLTRSALLKILPQMPISYLYGLRRVELRPRLAGVGHPFGRYRSVEKAVILYSLPPDEWRFPGPSCFGEIYQYYGADILTEGDFQIVRWSRPEYLACFMYEEVFLHELGHHKDCQYPCRNKIPEGLRQREISANRHAYKLAYWRSFEKTLGPIADEPLPGGA